MSTKYYLYVKTHNKSGLKYLGQTCQDPFKYRGSGVRWREHLAEYGFDIQTEIIFETEDKQERNKVGRYYSALWDVVNSEQWANKIPETGGGSFSGEWNPLRGKKGEEHPAFGRKDSEVTNKKRAKAKLGKNNPMYGIKGKDHPCSQKDQFGDKNHMYGKIGILNPNYGKKRPTHAAKMSNKTWKLVDGKRVYSENPRVKSKLA